jgi:hypothetical protein
MKNIKKYASIIFFAYALMGILALSGYKRIDATPISADKNIIDTYVKKPCFKRAMVSHPHLSGYRWLITKLYPHIPCERES